MREIKKPKLFSLLLSNINNSSDSDKSSVDNYYKLVELINARIFLYSSSRSESDLIIEDSSEEIKVNLRDYPLGIIKISNHSCVNPYAWTTTPQSCNQLKIKIVDESNGSEYDNILNENLLELNSNIRKDVYLLIDSNFADLTIKGSDSVNFLGRKNNIIENLYNRTLVKLSNIQGKDYKITAIEDIYSPRKPDSEYRDFCDADFNVN